MAKTLRYVTGGQTNVTFVTTPRVRVVGRYAHPEGVAAGLARVSRSAESIEDLVKQASEDTDLARKRNETIVFGYGHSSVAEHACFSLAISDIPRSLSLELVGHRLASYTQLSYRYVPLLPEEIRYYLPAEYRYPRQQALVQSTTDWARSAFFELHVALTAHLQAQHPELSPTAAARRATEDARYVLPIAQTTQLGMTANARTWGHVISRLRGHPLSEAQELGEQLFATLHPMAPSLFPDKHLGPDTYTWNVAAAVREASLPPMGPGNVTRQDGVVLLQHNPLAEQEVATRLMWRTTGGPCPCPLPSDVATAVLKASFRGLRAHDRLPREFELAHYTFDVLLSEVALHQLVRHRPCTIIPAPRSTRAYGLRPHVTPPQITDAGQSGPYEAALTVAWGAYQALGEDERAGIVLCGGHLRQVLIALNARELCEMSRLRMDTGAQWEIRALVGTMAEQVASVHPTIGHALGGRTAFKQGELPICPMT